MYQATSIEARTVVLELRRARDRGSGLAAHPAMAGRSLPAFTQALENAYAWAQARDKFPRSPKRPWTVEWCLRNADGSTLDEPSLDGGSLGAAFGVGLAALFGLSRPSRRRLDPDAYISARLDANGALDTVTELNTKVAALAGRRTRLLVARKNETAAQGSRRGEFPAVIAGSRARDAMVFAALPRSNAVPAFAAVGALVAGLLAYAGVQEGEARDAQRAHQVQELAAVSRQKLASDPAAAALAAATAVSMNPDDAAAQASLLGANAIDSRFGGVLAEDASTVDVSPDGVLLATGGPDHSVELRRIDRAGVPRTGYAGGGRVTASAFSRDGRYLFTGDEHGRLVRWDVETLAPQSLGTSAEQDASAIRQVAVSPDGALVGVLGNLHRIDVLDARTGAQVGSATVAATVTSAMFTAADTLVAGVVGRRVTDQLLAYRVRHLSEQPTVLLRARKSPFAQGVSALAVSRDGTAFVSGDLGGHVTVWDTASQKRRRSFDAGTAVYALNPDEHADAALVTTFSGPGVSTTIDRATAATSTQMWDLAQGRPASAAFGGGFGTAAVAADGALRTAVIRTARGAATVWTDLEGNRLRQDGIITDIVPAPFLPGSVFTAGAAGRIDLVDAAQSRIVRSIPPANQSPLYSLAASAPSKLLASGHEDGTVLIRDLDGTVRRQLSTGQKAVYRLAFSPDGRSLAAGAGGTVSLWDVATGRRIETWSTGANVIHQVIFGAGGRRVYAAESRFTGSAIVGATWWAAVDSGTVHDVRDDQYTARGMTTLPDGRVLVGEGDGSVSATDDNLRPLPVVVSFRHDSNVLALASSTSAGRVVSGGADDRNAVLRADDLTLMAQLPGLDPNPREQENYRGVYSAAITADGRYAVFGGNTGRIQILPLATDVLVKRACLLAGRPATAQDLNVSEETMPEVPHPC
ncbi:MULTISPECIES: WD40 repeat domain-containing protein [Amycolatopsis]|uniref:WD40 repeat domain-containing protein n=2 Tax=Amycolatopsis TaxID=1813 RepID=A0ABW5I8T8_9PSEU